MKSPEVLALGGFLRVLKGYTTIGYGACDIPPYGNELSHRYVFELINDLYLINRRGGSLCPPVITESFRYTQNGQPQRAVPTRGSDKSNLKRCIGIPVLCGRLL